MADITSDAVLILDDFTSQSGTSTYGTAWQGFTDRVMGGRSDMRAGISRESGDSFLRMAGVVSLENNGGFIQARLPWSYYAAPVPVDTEWRTVRIPFDAFRSSSALRGDMPDLQRLQSIAIVAGTVAFEADIAVRQIALYR